MPCERADVPQAGLFLNEAAHRAIAQPSRVPSTTPAITTANTIMVMIHAQKQDHAHRASASLYTAMHPPHSSSKFTGRPSCLTRGLGGKTRKTAPASHSSGHATSAPRPYIREGVVGEEGGGEKD